MNKKQLIVLWIGIGIIAVMGLFPPWHMKTLTQIEAQTTLGYAFILAPPTYQGRKNVYPMINMQQLFVQWTIVFLITTGFIVTFGDKQDKKPKE